MHLPLHLHTGIVWIKDPVDGAPESMANQGRKRRSGDAARRERRDAATVRGVHVWVVRKGTLPCRPVWAPSTPVELGLVPGSKNAGDQGVSPHEVCAASYSPPPRTSRQGYSSTTAITGAESKSLVRWAISNRGSSRAIGRTWQMDRAS